MEYKKKAKAKKTNDYDNFFGRRKQMTANILGPAKIMAFKSTESRELDGGVQEELEA